MKALRITSMLLLCFIFVFTSCRKEDEEIINPPQEESLDPNSTIANLLNRIATNDGSIDNIIDNASCLRIQLPVTVIANGTEVIVNTPADYQVIEDIFDASDIDTDTLEIIFPITVIRSDYTTVVVNTYPELLALIAQCGDENSPDDDIECIDFQYPITVSIFNTNNELIETIVINSDAEMYNFINNLDSYDIVVIEFPITVILADGTSVEINSLQELEAVIIAAADSCDEDDDNDYNDDDCDTCTVAQVIDLLTGCDGFFIDKLERNDDDLEDNYTGYNFVFTADGSIAVTSDSGNFTGTWTAMGEGNGIDIDINITGLPELNDVWNLHEIETGNEQKFDLRLGDDRLRFECGTNGGSGGNGDCANCTVAQLTQVLTDCPGFFIERLELNNVDLEDNYIGFDFNFFTDGTVISTSTSGNFNGTWTATGTGNNMIMDINITGLPEINNMWNVHEIDTSIPSETYVDLRLGNDRLRFESDCDGGGGGGGTTLDAFLIDGTWFVSNYDEDGDNQTNDYAGYTLDFDANGSVIATNGTPINGTWNAQNNDTELFLNFTGFPFDEFNDNWDVLSATNTEVVLQDVSGGGGGIDNLTFTKL